jgi:ribosomal protein S18 acetylase RimI-like enzyme
VSDSAAGRKQVRIEIRDARIEDLGAVVDLWDLLVDHHSTMSPYFVPARDSREKWSKYLAKKFSEKSTKLLVAEEGGDIVGFMLCLLTPNKPIFRDKTVGVISDVYVSENRRNRGVMKEMLKAALKWFKKNKIQSVELSVAAANVEARSAWGQLGFKPYLIQKRIDLDKYPAKKLLEERSKTSKKKVVRKNR